MLNKATLMGRLCADPVPGVTSSGRPYCNFRFAVDRDYASKDGARETDFFSATAWGGTADFITRNFTKGKMIAMDGRIEPQEWVDREGNKRSTTKIVVNSAYFAGSKQDGETKSAASSSRGRRAA